MQDIWIRDKGWDDVGNHTTARSVSVNINLLAPELFFFNFSTPCILNVNNTGTKYVRIMKQTAF